LRGHGPRRPETLPHPNVHLVLEPGRTRIQGVHTGRFTRVLAGEGGVFGIKFRPGGFRPFLGRPVSTLRNRSAAFCDVFGPGAARLESEIFAHREDAAMLELAERFFAARLPPPDPDVDRIGEIVDGVAADCGITTVEQVAERWQFGKRTLQRLFNEYVGVGPKWVINRYPAARGDRASRRRWVGGLGAAGTGAGLLRPGALHTRLQNVGRPSTGGLCARPLSCRTYSLVDSGRDGSG
jgi:hypothetical protein